MAAKRKIGGATKDEGGLPEVLFFRANAELIDRLDKLVQKKNEEHPYQRKRSRADVAREILYTALDAEGIQAKGRK